MTQTTREDGDTSPLFRSNAMRAASDRLFGSVTAVLPPTSYVTVLSAIASLLALGFVTWYVEIPQRAAAVGVLMPPSGFLDVVADAPGRVVSVEVAEGQSILAGDGVLTVTTDQSNLVVLKLQALRQEIELLVAANQRQSALDESHERALDEQADALRRQLDAVRGEHGLQERQADLLQRRLNRLQGLAVDGNLSADALDREQAHVLQARARSASLRRTIIEVEQGVGDRLRARGDAIDEAEQRGILHQLEYTRLQRQIEQQEFLIDRQISSPAAGTIARVIVRRGDAVRSGDALVRMYRRSEGLEAWLYLSSAKAGFLRAGQSVELQLDAYPHQLFGTTRAVITSVSEIAMAPREVPVPLLLNGPVFEVRATLDQEHVDAFDATWRLLPGTSFQADLIQRRYRLYEWLLRAVVKGSDDSRV